MSMLAISEQYSRHSRRDTFVLSLAFTSTHLCEQSTLNFQIMSFEVTATIANFGGKLLKLAHQVNISTKMAIQVMVNS
jgi:hypothetical protein